VGTYRHQVNPDGTRATYEHIPTPRADTDKSTKGTYRHIQTTRAPGAPTDT